VLEKWITGSPFEGVDGSSDLQMARGPHAREILEKHWDGFITEQDFEYIASRGINTVRIPVCPIFSLQKVQI
jgi:glucan 1,3-beta-glucosidase